MTHVAHGVDFHGHMRLGQAVRVIVCRRTISNPNYAVTNGFRLETETHIYVLAPAGAGGVNAHMRGPSRDNHDGREILDPMPRSGA